MKKENSINSQKCLEMDLNETSLAQLILENFAVNKETYKILEEREIFDKVCEAMNTESITASMLRLAFIVILLYVCFAFLPLWAAVSLIGIKLAIPVVEFIKYITVAERLIKDDKDISKKLLSIRLKIANLEK